jgi:lipopolysaccharide export system protein LptA
MASLKRIWTLALACGGVFVCGPAMAQLAPGTGNGDPIATTSDKLERYDDKHMTVLTGGVEAVQAGARLVCDKLTVYSYGPGEGPAAQPGSPGAQPAATPAPGGKQAAPDQTSTSSVKQMVAEGHVFYVTQNETARGDRGVYDAEPDTITMTGAVIVVQGKNVLRGDKMIIDRKTGQTTVVSDATGRNNPKRVQAVIYNDQNAQAPGAQAQPAQAQGQNAAKAPAAPAKKP